MKKYPMGMQYGLKEALKCWKNNTTMILFFSILEFIFSNHQFMIMATIVHRDNRSCCNDIIIARTNYIGFANIYKEIILRTHATVLAISQIPYPFCMQIQYSCQQLPWQLRIYQWLALVRREILKLKRTKSQILMQSEAIENKMASKADIQICFIRWSIKPG